MELRLLQVLQLQRGIPFEPNLGAANDQDSYTFVYGDNARLFRAAYCQAQSIDLSSEMDGVLGLNASLFAHYPEDFTVASAFTDRPDPDSQPEILTNHAKIYIADVSTTIWSPTVLAVSANLKEGLISSLSFRFPSGLAPLKTGLRRRTQLLNNRRTSAPLRT